MSVIQFPTQMRAKQAQQTARFDEAYQAMEAYRKAVDKLTAVHAKDPKALGIWATGLMLGGMVMQVIISETMQSNGGGNGAA